MDKVLLKKKKKGEAQKSSVAVFFQKGICQNMSRKLKKKKKGTDILCLTQEFHF
jgi:hypothetical protein